MNHHVALAVEEARTEAPATPVMAQYFAAKARQPMALIFFRMGDFYELFFDDAKVAAAALGIALTKRGVHQGEPIPMAGVPIHAADSYLAKLIRAGHKVAVCEQLETPAEARKRGAKSIVRRDLVRVVTPGTLTEDALLEVAGANRLAAVAVRAGAGAVASVEISTGEVECARTPPGEIVAALAALAPSEIVISERLIADPSMFAALSGLGVPIEPLAAASCEAAVAEARLKRLYGVHTLDSFGPLSPAEVAALGLLAAHLETTQVGRRPALRPPRRGGESEVMAIDPTTRASLEIEKTLSGSRQGSLLSCIDRTITGPGARLLASRLARPLAIERAIEARLDCVQWLLERGDLRRRLRETLKGGDDMARALGRLSLGRGGPRDLERLKVGLASVAAIGALLGAEGPGLDAPPDDLASAMKAAGAAGRGGLARLLDELTRGLVPMPAANARDGGFVAPGFSEALDEAHGFRDDSRRIIASLEARLATQAGVALRIRHNAVLGYYIEASARQAEPLLRDPLRGLFIHRQTLANQVRFTTAELAALDATIAEAAERSLAIEIALFETWRESAVAMAAGIHAAADAAALVDLTAALAEWAAETGAVRPSVDGSLAFEARGARHPVVEAAVRREGKVFTANDCVLDADGRAGARVSLVTGPNMAGKSTFLRQNALLCILAQAGSFVPARSFRTGVVDRLFSRVGASDDLARGRSTFMTEMVETAAILIQATRRSFVIMDEIGRGTATWDGLAIAWACVEALHEANGCRTLFATHYHELAMLEEKLPHFSNVSMKAREWNGELVFLHEAASGPADRSYGVQVAKLAGVPRGVVARAQEVLATLELGPGLHAGLQELPLFAALNSAGREPSAADEAARSIQALDLDALSPREALDALYRLQAMLR